MAPQPLEAATPFPVFLDLAGKKVLVVGGGEAAVAKCRLFGRSGAPSSPRSWGEYRLAAEQSLLLC
jgi:hypothetical protein